ncbi:peptidoglycan-binding protein [Desulfobacula sp.]|uniref:peptidoglycan-binding domain-containing protein n=1 Tax=Desulfobacula sp. TaxID=2593537 RepID=UPI0026041720|nr:peptidoglycan-binding protein [Desulfobacula sp.]
MAITWTASRNHIQGSRWDVWNDHFKDMLTWEDFRDNAAKHNPHLNKSTGWCFLPEATYVFPEPSSPVAEEPGQNKDALDIQQLIDNDTVEAVLKSGSGATASVQALQNILKDLGFGTVMRWDAFGADGNYGQSTARAVRSFAVKNGFTANGEKVTRAIAEQILIRLTFLDDLRNIYNALKNGTLEAFYCYGSPHSLAVISLQTLLNELGYGQALNWEKYGADGDYGKSTAHAVDTFASDQGVPGDGLRLTRPIAEKLIDRLQGFYGDDWAQDMELPEKKINDITITETRVNGKRKIIISDGLSNTVRFSKFRKGVYYYGRQITKEFITGNTAELNRAGVTNSAINVMLAVSENEGNLDGINTWDNSFMTFGIFQWTLGAGKGPGELAALLKKIKDHHPALFETYYGRHGLDITETDATTGYMSLNGTKLSTPDLKEKLRTHEWAFYFWLSGQDKQIQTMEIGHALSRLDTFYTAKAHRVNGYYISDLITSEYGVGLILDNHVNRPGYIKKCLATALERTGLPDPETWGDNEEKELIRHYLQIRETYGKSPMTHASRRAEVTAAYLENGFISDARGSFRI